MQNSLDKPWTPAVFYPGSLNGSHNRIKLPFVERVTAGAPDQTRGTQTDTTREEEEEHQKEKEEHRKEKEEDQFVLLGEIEERRGSFKVKA